MINLNEYEVYASRKLCGDHILLKRSPVDDETLPRFVRLYEDWTWTAHASKYNSAPVIARGVLTESEVDVSRKLYGTDHR